MTETVRRRDLRHEAQDERPDRRANILLAVALTALVISAGHLYGLGDYSPRRVGVAFLAFAVGGALMAVAQLARRMTVSATLVAAGALMLAAPVAVFWLGA